MARYINLDKQLVRLYRLNLTYEDVIKEFLLSAEITDVPEKKVGKWVDPTRDGCITYDKNAYRECSCCGAKAYLGMLYHYCPNCGAEMEGGAVGI